jgi:hypothetical protein
MPELTILEGTDLNAAERRALADPRITTMIGLLYYFNHPAELNAVLSRAGQTVRVNESPGTLGVLPAAVVAIAGFAAPIISSGLQTFFQVKGEGLIADKQAKVYAEQARALAIQADMEKSQQQNLIKMIGLGLGGVIVLFILFQVFKPKPKN